MNEALADLSATDLATAYRERRLSPAEVTEAVLARISAWDDRICATWEMDAEAARVAARASDARFAAGTPLGPLDGVPATVKENIATRGVVLPSGTAARPGRVATEDAPPAARLREGGAVILGKTTMPDFGMLSSGLSSFHRLTRNPWNLANNPGGSSAGAAAGAAAGYGPIHIGTDIGGSVRLPAALCGVVGFKPSNGRIPVDPPYPGRICGPITRTVADAALATSVLAQTDARDYMRLPPAEIDWSAPPLSLRGLRIGLCLQTGLADGAVPALEETVQRVARLLEGEGAIVTPLDPFLDHAMLEGLDRFWRVRFRSDNADLTAEERGRILPYIRAWFEGGGDISAQETYRGFAQMAAISKATQAATAPFDFVLSPVWTIVSYAADWASPLNDPARPFDHCGYCLPYNMSGQPALSLPWGHTAAGEPLSVQIVGRPFDDSGVLRLSAALEAMRPSGLPWPRLVE